MESIHGNDYGKGRIVCSNFFNDNFFEVIRYNVVQKIRQLHQHRITDSIPQYRLLKISTMPTRPSDLFPLWPASAKIVIVGLLSFNLPYLLNVCPRHCASLPFIKFKTELFSFLLFLILRVHWNVFALLFKVYNCSYLSIKQ